MRFFGISLDSLCFWNKAYTGGIKVHSIESEQQAHYWELGTRFIADMCSITSETSCSSSLYDWTAVGGYKLSCVLSREHHCEYDTKFKRYQLLKNSPKFTYNDDSF